MFNRHKSRNRRFIKLFGFATISFLCFHAFFTVMSLWCLCSFMSWPKRLSKATIYKTLTALQDFKLLYFTNFCFQYSLLIVFTWYWWLAIFLLIKHRMVFTIICIILPKFSVCFNKITVCFITMNINRQPIFHSFLFPFFNQCFCSINLLLLFEFFS
jgi:hypothetical protein